MTEKRLPTLDEVLEEMKAEFLAKHPEYRAAMEAGEYVAAFYKPDPPPPGGYRLITRDQLLAAGALNLNPAGRKSLGTRREQQREVLPLFPDDDDETETEAALEATDEDVEADASGE